MLNDMMRVLYRDVKLCRTYFKIFRSFSTVPSTKQTLDLTGIYPPITTPFNRDEDSSLCIDSLQSNLKQWNQIPFRGYVVLGSNGEYVMLQNREKLDLVEHVRKMVPSEKLVIAGSGCQSTRETISLSNEMVERGADALLVVTPSFYKNQINDEALYNHYTKVADSVKKPVILYSVPANTGVDMSASVITKLASHPNIIGLKDSGGDITKITSVISSTSGLDFQVLAGSAGFLLPALSVGCVGGVCALANVLGNEICYLQNLHRQGKTELSLKLQQNLVSPNLMVTKQYGVAGLKHSMDLFGFYGGPVRSPLRPLVEAEKNILRSVFTDNGFVFSGADVKK